MLDTEHFKVMLLQERDRLRRQLVWVDTELKTQPHSLQDHMPESGDDEIADDATDTYTQELDAALARRAGDRLQSIESALERLQVGQYGACVKCERPIALGRLETLPWAPYCVSCAQDLEVLD